MRVRASRSAATTASAPFAFAAEMMSVGSQMRPEDPGYCTKTPKAAGSSAGSVSESGSCRSRMPTASARLARRARVCGKASLSTMKTRSSTLEARRASIMPSTTAVPSSSIEALAVSRPVRSVIIVWKLMSASRRPCEISG
jgi:hypothetical protein